MTRHAFLLCTGTLFTERGTIVTVFIVCYALTSFVAGYIRFGPCLLGAQCCAAGAALAVMNMCT